MKVTLRTIHGILEWPGITVNNWGHYFIHFPPAASTAINCFTSQENETQKSYVSCGHGQNVEEPRSDFQAFTLRTAFYQSTICIQCDSLSSCIALWVLDSAYSRVFTTTVQMWGRSEAQKSVLSWSFVLSPWHHCSAFLAQIWHKNHKVCVWSLSHFSPRGHRGASSTA